MSNRTFVIVAGLIVLVAVMTCAVFEFQSCRVESRTKRLVKEAAAQAQAKLVAKGERTVAIIGLQLAAIELESSPRLDELDRKLAAVQRGDRSDPKIEAMIERMIAETRDPSQTVEEVAAKLLREYEP